MEIDENNVLEDVAVTTKLTVAKSISHDTDTQPKEPGWIRKAIYFFVRVFLFLSVLGSLVLSKLSFVVLATKLRNSTLTLENNSVGKTKIAANFWRIVFVLVIPSVYSLLRCIWCGGISRTTKSYPWPVRKAVVGGIFVAFAESVGLNFFAFIVAVRMPNSALTIILMCGVFGGSILSQLLQNHCFVGRPVSRSASPQRASLSNPSGAHPSNPSSLEEPDAVSAGKLRPDAKKSSRWAKANKNVERFVKNPSHRIAATWIALLFQIAGIALLFYIEETRQSWHIPVFLGCALLLLSIAWCPFIQECLNTPEIQKQQGTRRVSDTARWKNGILTSTWRVVFIPVVAVAMSAISEFELDVDVTYLRDGFGKAFDLSDDTIFLVNVFSTWGAFLMAWVTCTVKMDNVGFVFPLLLSTPVAVATSLVLCTTQDLSGYLACENHYKHSANWYGTVIGSLVLLCISQIICCLFYAARTKLIPLVKEQDLFIQCYYNCPFTDQSLMLNRKVELDDSKVVDPVAVAGDSRVFVCTTMYRETIDEQRQLLQSIRRLDRHRPRRKFESHIFFDGGANRDSTTEFANQLFSVLEKVLEINLSDGEKWETPYGLQFRWRLPDGLEFFVHLKDPSKVKKKKRWSQVMYMSYVLDHRCSDIDDDNTFILTTDADIVFQPDSVEMILDLLCRDSLVGGVCGRVHPLGSGPLVWYQKFDYAIGHWFQKVAEDVLGSVMCCPGCFSVFRARAIRDVLPFYATNVEKAKDFLTKDMGEDRWLCTLLVENGWRLEYSAGAESSTYCPDNFDEFYKQRRRWTPSTLANLMALCSNAKEVIDNSDAVSIVFIVYQAAMIFSTIIAPGTVILVMAAGLSYSFDIAPNNNSNSTFVAFLIIFILVSLAFGTICVYCRQETQLMAAKVLTLIFAVVMAAVTVGVAVQIVEGFNEETVSPTPTLLPPNNSKHSSSSTNGTGGQDLLEKVAISTWYLGGLASLFILAAALHPYEFLCLFHGIWYLISLPSGYLFLIIYSICNLNDVSWGTRESANRKKKGQSLWDLLKSFAYKLRDIWGCCECCYRSWPSDQSSEKKSLQTNAEGGSTYNKTDKGESEFRRQSWPSDQLSKKISLQTSAEGCSTDKGNSEFRKHGLTADLLTPLGGKPHLSGPVPAHAGEWLNSAEPRADVSATIEHSLSIQAFLERVGLGEEYWVQRFVSAGYDDTSFFIKPIGKKEFQSIGVSQPGIVKRILREIDSLPETSLQRKVPKDIGDWLERLGLSEYRDKFKKAGYETANDVLSLVSVLDDSDESRFLKELGIKKQAHLKKLEFGIKAIEHPSSRDQEISKAKIVMQGMAKKQLQTDGDQNDVREFAFWNELLEERLKPDADQFNRITGKVLTDKLRQLRNQTVVMFFMANIIWIVLITLLGSHAKLTVLRTNALGFAFLVVYGVIFCIQFLALLWHRLITIIRALVDRERSSRPRDVNFEDGAVMLRMPGEGSGSFDTSVNSPDGVAIQRQGAHRTGGSFRSSGSAADLTALAHPVDSSERVSLLTSEYGDATQNGEVSAENR